MKAYSQFADSVLCVQHPRYDGHDLRPGAWHFGCNVLVWVEERVGDKATVNIIFGLNGRGAGLGSTMLGGWTGGRRRGRFQRSYFWGGNPMLVGFPWSSWYLCCLSVRGFSVLASSIIVRQHRAN